MAEKQRMYLAIDLKSFYASVECLERGLDPLTTNLVVADTSRTEKTIVLAVSPSLKAYGIPGRPRLFEVVREVKRINAGRLYACGRSEFTGRSCNSEDLAAHPDWRLDYVVATPRMAKYMEFSTKIYETYLKYIAPEDIHVYSIDEVFIDVTGYLHTYGVTAHELCMKLIQEVLKDTGVTATGGIGTNMYLAKIAMDIVAKHIPADEDGVRIAELDELSYRKLLWAHKPLTDFWRVGKGTAKKLETNGMYTMGDVARCSVENEALLYKLFGVNAELLIDHAWGYETADIAAIRAYEPENNSIGSGHVLPGPYTYEQTRMVVREMADSLAMDLVSKGLVSDQVVLTVNYDRESLERPDIMEAYDGPIGTDWYGRPAPKAAHGSINLGLWTASSKVIVEKSLELFERICHPALLTRKVNITANHALTEAAAEEKQGAEQLSLFSMVGSANGSDGAEVSSVVSGSGGSAGAEDASGTTASALPSEEELEKERRKQQAILELQEKYGKNAVLKGTAYKEGATTRERNGLIGGHKA